MPLSFRWDGRTLLLATASASPTARNPGDRQGPARSGRTRDVVLIEWDGRGVPGHGDLAEEGDAFAVKTDSTPGPCATRTPTSGCSPGGSRPGAR